MKYNSSAHDLNAWVRWKMIHLKKSSARAGWACSDGESGAPTVSITRPRDNTTRVAICTLQCLFRRKNNPVICRRTTRGAQKRNGLWKFTRWHGVKVRDKRPRRWEHVTYKRIRGLVLFAAARMSLDVGHTFFRARWQRAPFAVILFGFYFYTNTFWHPKRNFIFEIPGYG